MSLFLDIGTGAGLAGSAGVRPYLPPLLAGGLARGDVGIDFDGTDFRFLESTAFLAAVLVVGAIGFLAERSAANRSARGSGPARGGATASAAGARRDPVELFAGVAGIVLAALLFAGALADGGHAVWIGLVLGPLVGALAWLAVGGLVERVRARLDADASALLTAYADAAALVLAAIAIFVPPVAFLAILGFAVLLLGGRRREGRKYAGLRILR